MNDNTNPVSERKRGLLKNDRLFVCSMLAFYGICILGLIAGTFLWMGKRKETETLNATSTAEAVAARQANATATAVAYVIEQDGYDYIERFDGSSGLWFVGVYEKQYSDTQVKIEDGFYKWDIFDSKNYALSTEFRKENIIRDFDVYMDVQLISGSSFGETCSGFYFRMPTNDWNDGAYTFVICDNSHYEIQYYAKNEWQPVTFSEYQSSIQSSDWNRLGISARGERFTFTINHIEVFEMTDDRLEFGSLGIFIDIEPNGNAEIWFDNFGFRRR